MKKITSTLILLFSFVLCFLLTGSLQKTKAASTDDTITIVMHKLALKAGTPEDQNGMLENYDGVAGATYSVYDISEEYYALRAQGIKPTSAQDTLAWQKPTSEVLDEQVTVNTADQKGAATFTLPRYTASGKDAVYIFHENMETHAPGEANFGYVVILPIYDEAGQVLNTVHAYAKHEPIEEPVPETEVEKHVEGFEQTFEFGNSIPYVVAVTIPETIAKVEKFVIKDVSNGDYLQPQLDSMSIMVGDKDVSSAFKLDKIDRGFTLTLTDFNVLTAYPNQTMTISYQSLLVGDEDTEIETDFVNKAIVTVDSVTTSTEVEVITGAKYFQKVDLIDQSRGLAGAKFVIRNKDGKYLARHNGTNEWVSSMTDQDIYSLVSDNSGAFAVTGLLSGDYELVEVEAPVGYIKSTEPVSFKIDAEKNEQQATLKIVNQSNKSTILPTPSTPSDTPKKSAGFLPQTGEIAQIGLVLLGLMMIGVLIVVKTHKKEGNAK